MKIYLPYAEGMLQPETEYSMIGWPGEVHKEVMPDEYAYWRMIQRLWRDGIDFCLVEQDIAPTLEQLRELEDCGELFCSFAYLRESVETVALGLTRVRGKLCQDYPRLLETEVPNRVSFHECDGWLYSRIGHTGTVVHRHDGLVKHYRRQTMLVAIPGLRGEAGHVR